MIKFITFCMGFILLSFIAVPIYYGVASEHKKIIQAPQTTVAENNISEPDITLAQIYELASEDEFSPENLNNIMPASGGHTQQEGFSNGFNAYTHNNL